MSSIPPTLRGYLLTPLLQPLWSGLRERLERTGHAIRGTISVPLDDDGADRLSGLLGRPVPAGEAPIRWLISTLPSGQAWLGAAWSLS